MTVKIPAWSFSSIKTFEQCPKKFYHLKVAKDFQAAQRFWTVDGTRKWSAGDDWFYDIKEKT